jgi:hypothetical protein
MQMEPSAATIQLVLILENSKGLMARLMPSTKGPDTIVKASIRAPGDHMRFGKIFLK